MGRDSRRVRGPLGKKPGPQGPVWVPVHVYQLPTVCCQGDGEHGSGARHPVGSRGPRKWEQQCFYSCLNCSTNPSSGGGKGARWLRTQSVCGKLRAGPWGPKMTEAESLCTVRERQVQITVCHVANVRTAPRARLWRLRGKGKIQEGRSFMCLVGAEFTGEELFWEMSGKGS